MNRFLSLLLLAFAACILPSDQVFGFQIRTPSTRVSRNSFATFEKRTIQKSAPNRYKSTALFLSQEEPPKGKLSQDGVDRGIPILGLVLLACVWIFSIPPEFRRAYVCSDGCAENRSLEVCHNCVTADEWKQGVIDYYKNGGGIQFDFSVAPETKAFWSGKR